MPLSSKGEKIMKAMRKKYGKKKGKSIFYASKNKGTIKGVYEDMDINEQSEKSKRKAERKKAIEKKLGPRTNFPEGQASDDVTPAPNPHGTSEHGPGPKRGVRKVKGEKKKPKYPRLVDVVRRTGKKSRIKRAKEIIKKNLQLQHTVYHDMGYLMAESLGLISEKTRMAKKVQEKGLSYKFTTAGGKKVRGGSLVRKASIEPGGALRPGSSKHDGFRTGEERAKAVRNTRSRGGVMAQATDKEIARTLATRGTRPLAKPGSPAAKTQKKIETENRPFSPMLRKLQSTGDKAKKIAAERENPKTTAKRDK